MMPLPVHVVLLGLALAVSVRAGQRAGRLLGGANAGERAALGFLVVVAWWTLGGYALGAIHALASPWAWLAWLALGGLPLGAGPALRVASWRSGPRVAGGRLPARAGPRSLRRWLRLAVGRPYLGLALLLLAWVAATNVVILLWPAPNSFDAMLYHLTRVAYYLQQGSLEAYGANQFSQDQLGQGSAVLLCGLYALGGRSDLVAGWPQFSAWLVGGATAFALARTWRVRPVAAAFAGVAGMLLSVAWLEATTAQNDLLIATEIAAAFLCLRRYRLAPRPRWLVLAGVAIGLAVGTKASALLLLPALALANGPALWRPRVVLLAGLAALPFLLPAGYVDNFRRYGHPLGAEALTEHVTLSAPLSARLGLAARNALRFALDAGSLDRTPAHEGLSRRIAAAKAALATALAGTALDPARPGEQRMPFWPERLHLPDENLSYFGPFGLCLLAGLVVALRVPAWRWPAAAWLLFVALQCLVGPYDLIRGRQFLAGAAFLLPAFAGWAARWRRPGRTVAALAVLLAAGHVAPAAFLRNNYLFLPADGRPAFWQLDRLDQMTRWHTSHPAQRAFAARVPPPARVGVGLWGYEYPLFGYRHARRLVPVLERLAAGQGLPPGLDWLVFTPGAPPRDVRPDDVDLGAGWYLRRLSPAAQQPP